MCRVASVLQYVDPILLRKIPLPERECVYLLRREVDRRRKVIAGTHSFWSCVASSDELKALSFVRKVDNPTGEKRSAIRSGRSEKSVLDFAVRRWEGRGHVQVAGRGSKIFRTSSAPQLTPLEACSGGTIRICCGSTSRRTQASTHKRTSAERRSELLGRSGASVVCNNTLLQGRALIQAP